MLEEILGEFRDFLADVECAPAAGETIVADDKRNRYKISGDKKKDGIYQLKISGDFGVGWVRNHREGVTHKWHSKVRRKLSAEEKKQVKDRIEAEQHEKEGQQREAEQKTAHRAKLMWMRAHAEGTTEYITRKKIKAIGCKYSYGTLVIPVYIDNEISSLQFISPNGEKKFLKDGRIKGGYAPIADKDDDKSTIIICEGFATGCSIRMATNFPVVCAFNAGNLIDAAEVMRKRNPEAKIIIAADNDYWTPIKSKIPDGMDYKAIAGDQHIWAEWREKGFLINAGIEKAKQAALKIGAHVIWPEFSPEIWNNKPTDFNDLHVLKGLEAVKERILAAMPQQPPGQPDRESIATPDDYENDRGDALPPLPNYEGEQDFFPYNILGHNDGIYYFLSKSSGQVVALSSQQLGSITNLYRLAPHEYWTRFYGDEKTSSRKIAERACNHLIETSHRRGVFRAQNIRGIGVWRDEGRNVLHCGDFLYVDGKKYQPHDFNSQFIYPMRESMVKISDDILNSKEAVKLRELCTMLSWENKLSGELLAGWCVIAPICAALPWRPHIWVTGESQSGKTTVLHRIILPIVGNIAMIVEGGTTEPSLRQELGCDGRPIIYDEAESENQRDMMIMEGILGFARRSSSGGTIIKGSSGGKSVRYNARSAMCFAGINPAIKHRADESRISQLVLKKMGARDAENKYKDIKKAIRETITEDFALKLFSRTLANINVILENVVIFTDAAAEILCDRRAADQIGAMLAGLYSLNSPNKIEYKAAIDWIKKHDWKVHTAVSEQSDPERLIMHMATKSIRYQGKNSMHEETVGDLIKLALGIDEQERNIFAEKALRNHGIWPREDGVWIANKSPSMERLLQGTTWHTWSRTLGDIPGAEKKDPYQFATGLTSRAVCIPYIVFGIQYGNSGEEIDF